MRLQTEWKEEHSYNDPTNTLVELRNWFMDMIQTFPDNRKLKLLDNLGNKTKMLQVNKNKPWWKFW
ncbi:MAG: hypothetical protein IPO24_18120 [Bacteroidetes bacterium]|nr:hypothetical protein [Bacteroidota bacterium]